MNKENTQKLFDEFPRMFRGHSKGDFGRTLMGFGFMCGDGWFDLIYNLCKAIQKRINEGLESEDFIVLEVKEKFAGLRFYCGSATEETFKLIHEAEDQSYHICEECGAEGIGYKKTGWYRTLCQKCAGDEWEKVGELFKR